MVLEMVKERRIAKKHMLELKEFVFVATQMPVTLHCFRVIVNLKSKPPLFGPEGNIRY